MLLLIMKEKYYCYIPFEGITIDPKGRAQLCPVWTANEEHVLHDLAESHKNIDSDFPNKGLTIRYNGRLLYSSLLHKHFPLILVFCSLSYFYEEMKLFWIFHYKLYSHHALQ